jgi:hypothetical protein
MASSAELFAAELPRRSGAQMEVVLRDREGPPLGLGDFDLLAGRKQVGRIGGLRIGLPTLASAAGAWSLHRHGTRGWNYSIMDADGAALGAYEGNRWRPGGHIVIASAEAFLGWRPPSRYVLRVARTNPFVTVRRRFGKSGARLQLTVVGRAPDREVFDVLVLVTSAMLLLEQYVYVPVVSSGS